MGARQTRLISRTTTIANGETASSVLAIPASQRAVGIVFGPMTGTAVTVTGSLTSDGTFYPLSALNTAVSFTVDGTGKFIGFTTDVASAFQAATFVKFTSGSSEGAARTITVLCVGREE